MQFNFTIKSFKGFLLPLVLFIGVIVNAQNDTIHRGDTIDIEKVNKRTLPGTHALTILASGNRNPLVLNEYSLMFDGESFNRDVRFHNLVDAIYLNYSYVLTPKTFIESGFRYVNYYTTLRTNLGVVKNTLLLEGSNSSFSTLSFNIGAGHRLESNKKKYLFNFLYGIAFGVVDHKKGPAGFSESASASYETINGEWDVFYYESSFEITNRVYYGAYLGVSKEFRITRNMCLNLRFQRQFAPFQRLTKHSVYYSLPAYNTEQELDGGLSPSGFMYGFGLSWFFGE